MSTVHKICAIMCNVAVVAFSFKIPALVEHVFVIISSDVMLLYICHIFRIELKLVIFTKMNQTKLKMATHSTAVLLINFLKIDC